VCLTAHEPQYARVSSGRLSSLPTASCATAALVCTAALVSQCAVVACHCELHVNGGRWVPTHRPHPDLSSVQSHVIGPTKKSATSPPELVLRGTRAQAAGIPAGGKQSESTLLRPILVGGWCNATGARTKDCTRRTSPTAMHEQEAHCFTLHCFMSHCSYVGARAGAQSRRGEYIM
jgi:hypothetical protein